MDKKTIFTLLLIVIIASFLRLWKLGQVPPSPNWDETALGYNAYSIMLTGKDEYGEFLPIILRSYDDYKPAFYSYTITPFIKIFGLSVQSVRLPSALCGIITIIATFFLIRELFGNRTELILKRFSLNTFALLSSFLLAISPWHIQFSRIAFESNMGLTANVLAVLFFLKGIKKPLFLILAVIFFGANPYIYQSDKVFAPLLLLSLILLFRKELFLISKKYLFILAVVFSIIIFPMIFYTITDSQAMARAKGVSIFSDQTPLLRKNSLRIIEDQKNKDYLGLILDNRRIVFVQKIISGYLSHFNLNWLFISGDLARHHAPDIGLLYLLEFPLLFIGIYYFIFAHSSEGFHNKTKLLFLSWFLIAPIPASITSGVPHAVRTLNFLPTFQIFIALGWLIFISLILSFKDKSLKKNIFSVVFMIFIFLFVFNFTYYLNQYFVQQNYFNSEDWQYGYQSAVSKVKAIEDQYDKIIVTNKPYLDQSYMFFLFYLQYSPVLYQQEAKNSSGGFRENHKFGKFEFRSIDWTKEEKNSKILYIGRPDDFSKDAKIIETVNFLNGKPAISIVEG